MVRGGDLLADVSIAIGSYPLAVKYLETFYQHIKGKNPNNYSISTTGHSLGAFLAELLAYTQNLSAVTFESPGSADGLAKYYGDMGGFQGLEFGKQMRIYNYVGRHNFINQAKGKLGKVIHLESHDILPKLPQIVPFLPAALVICPALGPLWFGSYLTASGLLLLTKFGILDDVRDHGLDNFKALAAQSKIHLFTKWPPSQQPGTSTLWEAVTSSVSPYVKKQRSG